MQMIGGALFLVAYLLLYMRAKRAGASTALPFIGLAAACLLLWGGLVAKLLLAGCLSKAPGLSLVGWALLTATVFGAGNLLRLAQLLQQNKTKPARHVILGQVCKVTASWLLVGSNAMLFDMHMSLPRKIRVWQIVSVVAVWGLFRQQTRL